MIEKVKRGWEILEEKKRKIATGPYTVKCWQ